jgi:2'-5' RNA ligase
VPDNYAKRFPDPELYNHGHKPHVTLLFLGTEMSEGQESQVLSILRRACRSFAPFRVSADFNTGLKDFGPGDSGEKALWLAVKSDPRGEIERLHRHLRNALKAETFEVDHSKSFVPHVTWSYVPNDVDEKDRARMDTMVSDRFRDGFGWDVRSVVLSGPSGEKPVMLNPHVPMSRVPPKRVP